MSPEQCRAARAWLDWTIADLAERAHVGISTIRSFEGDDRTPIQNNLEAIRRALEIEGIVFTYNPDGSPLGLAGKTRGTQPRAPKKKTVLRTTKGRQRKPGVVRRSA
jgi:transcriptional regulator with XRE-family HTH domain